MVIRDLFFPHVLNGSDFTQSKMCNDTKPRLMPCTQQEANEKPTKRNLLCLSHARDRL